MKIKLITITLIGLSILPLNLLTQNHQEKIDFKKDKEKVEEYTKSFKKWFDNNLPKELKTRFSEFTEKDRIRIQAYLDKTSGTILKSGDSKYQEIKKWAEIWKLNIEDLNDKIEMLDQIFEKNKLGHEAIFYQWFKPNNSPIKGFDMENLVVGNRINPEVATKAFDLLEGQIIPLNYSQKISLLDKTLFSTNCPIKFKITLPKLTSVIPINGKDPKSGDFILDRKSGYLVERISIVNEVFRQVLQIEVKVVSTESTHL